MTKPFGTPGPRAIHPELCDSPSLGRCGMLANALFPRLIAQADDQGRLAGSATSVMLQCLPRLLEMGGITPDTVDHALAELMDVGMLTRYVADGESYIQLARWWRWQSGQRRAYPSRWPAPKGWVDLVYGIGDGTPETYTAASSGSPQRNAAIRGILPLRVTPARAGPARQPARGRCRAVPLPDAVPPATPAAASGGPGAASEESAFRRMVPRPGERK